MRTAKKGRALAAGLVVLAGAGSTGAETWNIDAEGTGDFPTLQAAIDAAASGDTIRLAPGIYRDRITRSVKGGTTTAVAFLKPGVSIVGENPFTTFLDGEEDHQCLVGEGIDDETELAGFTLFHGNALHESSPAGRGGGGILLYDSSPELSDLRFVGCNSYDGGGGVRVLGDHAAQRMEIYGCAFVYCWSGGRGGGLEMVGHDDANVKWNTFAGNFSEVRGGGAAIVGFEAWVDNNVWWLNCAHLEGGPLWCENADVVAECNVFWENYPEVDETELNCDVEIDTGEEPNTIADPLFCDVVAEDFSLSARSPAAEKNSGDCGAIGAYGVECGLAPAHLSDRSDVLPGLGDGPEAGPLHVRAWPNPAADFVNFAVTGRAAPAADVEVFDLRGRRVCRLGPDPAGDGLVWDACDDGGTRVVDGIYFARAAAGGESAVARVVVLRPR